VLAPTERLLAPFAGNAWCGRAGTLWAQAPQRQPVVWPSGLRAASVVGSSWRPEATQRVREAQKQGRLTLAAQGPRLMA
jgi:hypothetical protein